ncbi:hypothetical protein [Streptomyces sp. NPDC016172]|uniref:hypothetical protein n=1 Tax=Streptomyces sp. NPDC016172 TaxID=3364964 RepID=UPI0036FE129D
MVMSALGEPSAGDPNHTTRAYVRDLRDGRTVAFSSSSPDLVPGDAYDTSHVFVRHLR